MQSFSVANYWIQQIAVLFHVSPEYLRRFLEIWAWDCDWFCLGFGECDFWWPILKMDIIWKLLLCWSRWHKCLYYQS